MIPKIIHYCWFGGKEKPEDVKKYIASWKKYCPDYEIMEWNESNFDINENEYCREAYESRKWAFVSDYVRLAVLYKYGGIYMDTDVEVVKPFDPLLPQNGFLCFENNKNVSIGTIGAAKHSSMILNFLKPYEQRSFKKKDGSLDLTTNLKIITNVLVDKYNLKLNGKTQILSEGVLVLPMEAFIAKSYLTGWIMKDDTTFAIHHYAGSWMGNKDSRLRAQQLYYLRKYLRQCEGPLNRLAWYHTIFDFYGVKGLFMKTYIKISRMLRGGNCNTQPQSKLLSYSFRCME